MQPAFNEAKGVLSTTVGYTGGHTEHPTYEEVSTGRTGHAESIEVVYDPAQISYEQLLDVFWHNVDPTSKDGQFADRGTQYRTAIFYNNEAERRLAEESKKRLAESGKFKKPIVTEIVPASTFWPAEDSHQNYYEKNALRYHAYKVGSGRAGFLENLWGQKKH
jgi:methionine-S-sulfoxide reductase